MESWKKKIPLSQCANGTIDLRTVNGFRRYINRIAGKGDEMTNEDKNLVGVLRTRLGHCELAMLLQTPGVLSVVAETRNSALSLMEKEKQPLTVDLMKALVSIRVSSASSFKNLLEIVYPVGVSEFDWKEPRLNALPSSATDKLLLHQQCVFVKRAQSEIQRNVDGAEEVKALMWAVAKSLADVDEVMLDNRSSIAFNMTKDVGNALLSLVDASVGVQYEVGVGSIHGVRKSCKRFYIGSLQTLCGFPLHRSSAPPPST